MLAEQINSAGGINGREVHVIIKDSAGDPDKCLSFTTQLIWWGRRLHDSNFFSITVSPRVYSVMSHAENDPTRIVCKLY